MNELKSYTEYAVSTPTADFVIGFDFNYGEDAVNVTVDNVPATEAGYTAVYLNETTIRLSPSVPSGVVRLQRETDIDQTDHTYRAGAKFIAQTMDENFEQLRHSQQEVRDGFVKLADDTYEIIDTLNEVGQSAQAAADAAEVAAQLANNAAAQVNDKVSQAELDLALTPVNTSLDLAKRGIANRYDSSLTYNSGERVALANGDIVKSTIDGNTNDPNVDMTGWDNTSLTITTVDTVAELSSLEVWEGRTVDVKGYYTPTNFALAKPYQGGGKRVYKASLASINNGGTIINGWVLAEQNEVTVNHFGVRSGSGIANAIYATANRSILMSMFAAGIKKFVFIDDEYYIDGLIDFSNTSGIQIIGSKLKNSTLIRIVGEVDYGFKLGHFTSYNQSLLIEGITFFGSIKTNTGSWKTDTYNVNKMIWLGGLVNNVEFKDVDIQYCANAIYSTGTNNWNRTYDNVSCRYVVNGITTPEANGNLFNKVFVYFFQEIGVSAVGFGVQFDSCLIESNSTNNPGLIVSARGCSINGLYMERVAEGIKFAGSTANKGRGSIVQGSYITLRKESGWVGKCINIESGNGMHVTGNLLRNADYGIFGGAGTVNCLETANDVIDVTNLVGGEGIDSINAGRMTFRSNKRAEIIGLTRNGLENTLIKSSFTTVDNLMDVIINSGSYQWRTYLGGRTGSDGGVRPLNAGADLGSSGNPWGNGYIQTAWNVTSDENYKQDISSLTDTEIRVAQACAKLYVRYRLKDAVQEKGDEARYHFGVIAQRVKEAFEAEGLDPIKYGILCYSSWESEEELLNDDGTISRPHSSGGERWAVRYDELNCFVNAGQQALIEQILMSR